MTYPVKYPLLIAGLLLHTLLYAQSGNPSPRTAVAINEAWSFTKEAYQPTAAGQHLNWQPVQVPHTWNATDVMDDEPGYYRGTAWYKKSLPVNAAWKTKNVFLFFEGANQVTEVYINGKKAGEHIGGYTGFYIPISALLQFDGKDNLNEIAVKVNNSYNENIPPLSADFTFYGGIYRDVYVVATEDIHFTTANNGSNGLFITTPQVTAATASVQLTGSLINETATDKKLTITTVITDRAGKVMGEISSPLTAKAGTEATFKQLIKAVANPHLWSPEDPYLYTAITRIADAKTGQLLDQLTNAVGFRWFSFDGDKGFFLNGQPYKLVGANRHQDYQGLGNALPDELAWKDMVLLKQMGGNFLRIAHYPQDPTILKACDELGILASIEIPVVNEITESDSFFLNCANMQREMIRQNFNHPAIIIWCYMNEVLLRPHFGNDKPRQEIYFARIEKLAKMLDSLTRKEDPSRYTMLVNHGDFNRYKTVGLTQIPMLVGWNLYSGWYGGNLTDFPAFLERHHKEFPDKPLLVTEYGADADPRIRSFQPIRFDKSVEYTTKLHQYYLAEMLKRPFVAGIALWNLADFNSETREETMPHINNKGLLLWDRRAKDPYYYYQAILNKQPFVKIADAYWTIRGGMADSNAISCTQPVQVSSNLTEAELLLNGISFGKKKMENGMAEWNVPFVNGKNVITVQGVQEGKVYNDYAAIDFQLQPRRFADERIPFTQLNVLLGAQRYYIDEQRQQIWLPDQPYQSGSWGVVGGKPFKVSRLPYGTDKNILGTDDDPIYQTQQTGIETYRLDVPAGEYEVTLHFAELLGGTVKGLPYNLSNSARKEEDVQRSFNVLVNGALVLEHFDIARQYGVAKAITKKINITVAGNNGMRIDFQSIMGEPILNALQVKRLW
jgi:beta-galactosidase